MHVKRLLLIFALIPPFAGAARVCVGQSNARVVDQLDDVDFHQRRRAMHELLADQTLTFEAVRDLYVEAKSDEQRQRLQTVARHHYLRARTHVLAQQAAEDQVDLSEVGALGVHTDVVAAQQAPELGRPAIRVSERLAGFPAFAVLLRDDLIVTVNGEDLTPGPEDSPAPGIAPGAAPGAVPGLPPGVVVPEFGRQPLDIQIQRRVRPNRIQLGRIQVLKSVVDAIRSRFSRLIKQNKVGEPIKLTVVRENQTIQVEVMLGSFSALQTMYEQHEEVMVRMDGRSLVRKEVQFGLAPEEAVLWERKRRELLAAPEPEPVAPTL